MNPNYTSTYETSSNIDPAVAAGIFAVFAGMMVFFVIILLVVYVFMAICLMKIAKKTNTENAWFAWVPILNMVLMIQIAKKPVWWIILAFIPIINLSWIVLGILVWMAISERLGKPSWLGILIIVPLGNLIVPGYLAFSKSETSNVQQPPVQQPPIQQSPIA